MEQNQFKCTGDCMKCLPVQRAYCSCQHAYSNMKVLDNLMGIIVEMKTEISTISEKIAEIQNNESKIFDPTAQCGDGADNRIPETI